MRTVYMDHSATTPVDPEVLNEMIPCYKEGFVTEGILNTIPNSRLTGHPQNRVPGHVSFCFEFVEGESLLLMLDESGIMASSESACASGSLDPSHVLLARVPYGIAHGSLRLTMGKDNSDEDIDYVLEVLPSIIANLRKMSPLCS